MSKVFECLGDWSMDEIMAAAEHTEDCKGKSCRENHPMFNLCDVSNLCKGVIEMVDYIDKIEAQK